jgi:phospholipid transport system substrate-binding protein
MKDGDRLGYAGRYRKLDPAVKGAFNLPLMTRFAVGPVWLKASGEEQQQLISAFSDFSVATYASRFTKYGGEQFDVVGQMPASGGGVIVETRLTPGGGDKPVALNYLMRQDDKSNWRIIDVFLDGAISELATRRSEFNSIVERDGISALVNDLGEKSRQMGPS